MNVPTYGVREIAGVPVNPAALACTPGFPDDLELYRTLRDHLGKVDADRLWADAKNETLRDAA